MKSRLLLLSFFLLTLGLQAQETTAIPDANFEQALITLGIDSDNTLNGHILTSDAESVNTLKLEAYQTSGIITDLTGLEAFVHLDTLIIHGHHLGSLDVYALVELRYLDCLRNQINQPIDFSNNPLLEVLYLSDGADLNINGIDRVDLSHNPQIRKLWFSTMADVQFINLNNGNNDTMMELDITFSGPMSSPFPHVCIKVDEPQVAQNGGYPYSEWDIDHGLITYSFTDDLQQCALSTARLSKSAVRLYPNPATERIYLEGLSAAVQFRLYTLTGKRIKQARLRPDQATVEVSSLESGLYFYTLSAGHKIVKTGKLIKK